MTTAFTDLVGIQRPLQQAAMSRVTTPELVAAVSNAGALGMAAIGRGSFAATSDLLTRIEASTDRPFGAGFVVPLLDRAERKSFVDGVAERAAVVEFAFAWPDPELVSADTPTGWMVGTVDEARAAVDAGCSYVIAQGVEAGGHVRDTVPLAELIPAVRAAVDVPLVAAGGIGTRAAADRAFALGADAVRIGTRFLGASEADVHPRYLDLMVAASGDDTLWTHAYDVGWPGPAVPVRVLASAHAAAEATAADPVGHFGDRGIPRFGVTPPARAATGQIEAMALYAGTSVGDLARTSTAAEVIDEILGVRGDAA